MIHEQYTSPPGTQDCVSKLCFDFCFWRLWGCKASHQERWQLFEEFCQCNENWAASTMLASLRAERDHERRGEYALLSRDASWLHCSSPTVHFFLWSWGNHSDNLCECLSLCMTMYMHGKSEDLLKKYHGNEPLVDGIIASKDLGYPVPMFLCGSTCKK